jgi:hypothetical protein
MEVSLLFMKGKRNFNQYLQQLGRNAGLEDKLTPYCIRRATANALDGECYRFSGFQ